jgi:hypothetical protein
LRFAITSPPSGCEGDLHPQAVKHARRTKQIPTGRQTNGEVHYQEVTVLDESLVDYYRDQFGFLPFKAGKGLEMFLPIKTMMKAFPPG